MLQNGPRLLFFQDESGLRSIERIGVKRWRRSQLNIKSWQIGHAPSGSAVANWPSLYGVVNDWLPNYDSQEKIDRVHYVLSLDQVTKVLTKPNSSSCFQFKTSASK